MNADTLKGDWKQIKGKVKEQWGKLTDDDLNRMEGRRDQLAGAIQKRYGIEKEEAEKQVSAFEKECGHCHEEENRTEPDSRGRETHEKMVAGQNPMNNPSKEKTEGGAMRNDPRQHERQQSAQGNDPKIHKQQGGSGERMKDKEMAGEKNMEGQQPAGGQKQHSQAPRAKQ